MKKVITLFIAIGFVFSTLLSFGQEKKDVVIYSFIVNIVPNGFNIPLVGFVNLALGDHESIQVGFVNTTWNSFKGAQVGFVNTVGNNSSGVQVGFINTTAKFAEGAQVGFVNTAGTKTKGTQIGFVNTTPKLDGFQLGFINYADSLEKGIPLGFISIVRKGGFRAIELFTSEMNPVNLSLKIGVKPLYTIFSTSYNSNHIKPFSFGFGFGSVMPINKYWFFNPELTSEGGQRDYFPQSTVLSTKFGYKVAESLYFSAGPSLTWNYNEEHYPLEKPLFSFYNTSIGSNQKIIVGARIALGISF